ncbi:MAG TPA: hypothetical protein VF546_02890 [Pyrinomonadaceae bacterium]|jgi:hypothetical protein
MKKVITLAAFAVALFLGAGWAFISGANYELKDLSPTERMAVLDTTMIGEKWLLIGLVLLTLGLLCSILAVVTLVRKRKEVFS